MIYNLGLIYDFPAADLKSHEVFASIGLDTFLSPSIAWYHDYADEDSGGGDGDYALLSVSHSEPIGDSPVSIDLGASVGYNDKLFINGEGGHVNLSAGLSIKATEICTVSPVINYDMPFGDLEDAEDGNYDDYNFYGNAMAFAEIGLTYAYIIQQYGVDEFSVGATLKGLFSYSGGYAYVENMNYIQSDS